MNKEATKVEGKVESERKPAADAPSYKQRLEAHPFFWLATLMIAGFSSGIGAFLFVLEFGNVDLVREGEYIKIEPNSGLGIKWNHTIRQYTLDIIDDRLIEKPTADQIVDIASAEFSEVSRLNLQHDNLAQKALIQFDFYKLPNLLHTAIQSAPIDLITIAQNDEVISRRLASWLKDQALYIFSQQQEVLALQESIKQKNIANAKQYSARWYPATHGMIRKLNKRDQLLKIVDSEIEIHNLKTSRFMYQDWVPAFSKNFIEISGVLVYLRKTESEEDKREILGEWLSAALESINEQQRKLNQKLEGIKRNSQITSDQFYIESVIELDSDGGFELSSSDSLSNLARLLEELRDDSYRRFQNELRPN